MQVSCVWPGLVLCAIPLVSAELTGRVVDSQRLPIQGARVRLDVSGRLSQATSTSVDGSFIFRQIEVNTSGSISVSATGFGAIRRQWSQASDLGELQLDPAVRADEVHVSQSLLVATNEQLSSIPGSVTLLDSGTLKDSRLFTFDEALRKAPGVFARPEEGFGLRPNIGIRGLNPTRSTRVLLLEDGVPLAYAPYGDNASYYHPPIDRYEGVEIIKGSGQIAYGPMTVGGVINYVTPAIPDRPAGVLSFSGGNRDYANAHLQWGGTFRGTGVLLDGVRKQGEGARDNVRSGLNDFNVKVLRALTSSQTLSFKGNAYSEDSRVTYSGLRLDEYLAAPRQNPFRNDSFTGRRYGLSASHSAALNPATLLMTTAYGSVFSRDWWRQSSNSGQRPNDASDPACGGMANLYTTCGNEGRLRDYKTFGVDPRLRASWEKGAVKGSIETGFRAHFENQERIQANGATPLSRSGAIVENNERRNQAYSGFIQNRFALGQLTVTPGVRLEHVRYQRTNRLANSGQGAMGSTTLTQAIPGIGVGWNPSPVLTVFAGAHRGFAPPRTEDIITNAGGFVDLDSELSWNYEVGARARVNRNLQMEATYFRLDYSNQIIPASLAGGVGAMLTSAGRTRHEGMEAAGRWEKRSIAGSSHGLFLRAAWTWLPEASFQGLRFSNVAGFGAVSVSGNRLPYAAASMGNASAGYLHRSGANLMLEMNHTGRMFGDDLNTVNSTADGQRGAIPGNVVWNATLNVPLETRRTTLFVTTKNLFDRLVIVDRARGILPNAPRLVQGGVRFTF